MIVTYVCIDSTACIKLEEYQTAKVALEAGLKLAPGDMRFTKLIKECDERIAGMWAITLCLLQRGRNIEQRKEVSLLCMQKD